jgi:hypothetical protein
MSREWLKSLQGYFADRVELVGLVDLREEAAIGRAKEFNLGSVWTGSSLEEALKATNRRSSSTARFRRRMPRPAPRLSARGATSWWRNH